MNNWTEIRFDELVFFPPKIKFEKGEEVAFIEMSNLQPFKRYVTNSITKTYNGGSYSKFQNGDILFARITPCLENGKISQVVLHNTDKGIGSTEFFVFRAKDKKTDSSFLYYLSKSDILWKSALNSMVGASGRQRADAKYLRNLFFPIPPLPIQKKIAAVLSAYDDLIENNNRRIAILEKMAEEIYKEWFVRMRFPGHENTKFVKGVPEGWEVKKLKDICNIIMGQSPKSEFYNEIGKGLPFNQGVGTFGKLYPKREKFCTAKGRIAKQGDILFSVRAPVGRINVSDCKMIIGRGLAAINHKNKYNNFLFENLKHTFTSEDIIGNGAIFNSVTKSELENLEFIVPNEELIIKFEEIIEPVLKIISNIDSSCKNLKQTRDRLLPRLISGKLSVEELNIKFPKSMEE